MSSTAQTLTPPVRRRKYARYGPHRARMAFRHWRRSRPFWAGLLVLLGGGIITLGPASAYKVILSAGDVVWEGILVGALITIFGLFIWFQPSARHFFGVLVVVLALVSFLTSDIGGFIIGMTLAMTGGSMAFAWVPVDPASIKPHIWNRRARQEWRRRRQIERRARRAMIEEEEAREAAWAEVPVTGVPVEAVPGVEVPSREAPRREETVTAATAAEPGVIETTGEEVDRLPKAEAGVPADEQAPPPRRPRFGRRR